MWSVHDDKYSQCMETVCLWNEPCFTPFIWAGGCTKEISYSLRISLKNLQHSYRESPCPFKLLFVDTKGNMSTSVKRPGDLPEPNDNPHPYTDFEELEIESYIATDEKTREMHMDIENQIAEVLFVYGCNL